MSGYNLPETNLKEFVESSIQNQRIGLHTALPGIVTKYDAEKQRADIQLAIKRQIKATGGTVEIPILKGVPVVFPRSTGFRMIFNLSVNEPVLVLFAERSLERWKTSSGREIVEPADRPSMTHSAFQDFFRMGQPLSRLIPLRNKTGSPYFPTL